MPRVLAFRFGVFCALWPQHLMLKLNLTAIQATCLDLWEEELQKGSRIVRVVCATDCEDSVLNHSAADV